MKKLILAALLLAVVALPAFAFQADEGRNKSDAKDVFIVCRFARQPAFPVVVSKDKVVVWDSTSNDGVTITTSTTSHDALAAGITIDEIPGSSRDYSATRDEGYSNWGRVRVYGRHVGVVSVTDTKSSGVAAGAGDLVSTSSTAGSAGLFSTTSSDYLTVGTGPQGGRQFANASRDSVGVILNATSTTSWDVFVKCM